MIGAVHEKDTMTSVKAINKILRKPLVVRALLSSAVDQESGRVISNRPKNESAKTTNKRKKKIFTTALVLSSFSADAPKRIVTNRPKPTYKIMMLRPYKMASRLPPPFLRKNDTVIGMIGHTQGVKMANRPPRKPKMKIHMSDKTVSEDTMPPQHVGSIQNVSHPQSSSSTVYSQISGAVHILSSQALKRIGDKSVLATVNVNSSVNSWSNSRSPNSIIVMCQPSSIAAFRRTLSPTSSPLHVTGCTSSAAAKSGMSTNNIVKNLFILLVLYVRLSHSNAPLYFRNHGRSGRCDRSCSFLRHSWQQSAWRYPHGYPGWSYYYA